MDSHQEDILLIKRCLSGEQIAYSRLLNKYQQAVINICYRLVGDYDNAIDLAQESFVKAFNHLTSYDNTYKFSSWLFRIATNHSYDYLRKAKLNTVSIDNDMECEESRVTLQLTDPNETPDQHYAENKKKQFLQEAINKLPPDSRSAIILRHLFDKTYEEMAEIFNEPVGTVKARIHRARKRLAELLKPEVFTE